MPTRNLRNDGPGNKRLLNNAGFVVFREPATSARSRDHLQPAHRLRLKRMVKHRHKPIFEFRDRQTRPSPMSITRCGQHTAYRKVTVARIPNYVQGGAHNPMGARGIYLYSGDKDTLYRIHGTNQPGWIGHAISSGCIRLTNEDVISLYSRVKMGAIVVVLGPKQGDARVASARGKKFRKLFSAEPWNRRLTSTLEIFFGRLFGFQIYELHEAG